MKKMISMLLVVCMLCALCVSAFAANITETGTKSQNTVVKYGMASSYTVTIPQAVAIDVDTLQGSTTVKASDVVLASGEKLNVILNGDCNANNEFYLEDTADASNTLSYTISNANGEALSDDDVVMTVDSGNVAGTSAALKFALTSNVTKAGTYTDTLTFTIDVVEENDGKIACDECGKRFDSSYICDLGHTKCFDCCGCTPCEICGVTSHDSEHMHQSGTITPPDDDDTLTCSRCGNQVDETDLCDDTAGNVCLDCCGHQFYCDTCANTFHDITGPHQHGFIMPPCDECGSPTSEDELCSNGLCEDCCRMTCDGMCDNSWNEEGGDGH